VSGATMVGMNPPSSRRRPPTEPCLNCGDPTTGEYCPTCGQRKTSVHVSVAELLRDSVEDELVLNRKLPRTIRYLLLHPGMLTDEYVSGRVVRYTPPLRLYLVSSVVMFLVLSFVGLRALEGVTVATATLSQSADSARAAIED